MESKTPAACGDRGLEMLAGFQRPLNLSAYRAQLIASRYALPIETTALAQPPALPHLIALHLGAEALAMIAMGVRANG